MLYKLQYFLGVLYSIIIDDSCRCCKVDRPVTDGLNTDLHLDIGNGVLLEKVDKFCYLGDMLDADGGCDSAVTTRVRLKKYTSKKCKISALAPLP